MQFIRNGSIFSRFSYRLGEKCIHNSQYPFSQKHLEKKTGKAVPWWDSHYLLSRLNAVRVPFIQNGIYATAIKTANGVVDRTRLDGVKILEVGCGGGILCEELARLGANIVGLDIDSKVIETAKKHQALDNSIKNNLNYICESIHQYQKDNFEKYDSVVISEVIEHVPNEEKEAFLTSSIKALRPGGSLFVGTPSKTIFSRIVVVFLAELFNIIPKGTHEYDEFISEEDLIKMISNRRCEIRSVEGIAYNPLKRKFVASRNKSYLTHYEIHAVKTQEK